MKKTILSLAVVFAMFTFNVNASEITSTTNNKPTVEKEIKEKKKKKKEATQTTTEETKAKTCSKGSEGKKCCSKATETK
jgi:Na+-transporting methylmalonyl-CoA/oxaloacetate decarboxylase gamma subunit